MHTWICPALCAPTLYKFGNIGWFGARGGACRSIDKEEVSIHLKLRGVFVSEVWIMHQKPLNYSQGGIYRGIKERKKKTNRKQKQKDQKETWMNLAENSEWWMFSSSSERHLKGPICSGFPSRPSFPPFNHSVGSPLGVGLPGGVPFHLTMLAHRHTTVQGKEG